MATSVDIAPSTGATTSFLQAGPGASPGYSAIDVRRALGYGSLQEGVIDSGSYMVTQRAAGANMSVDVAAENGNGAYVQGDAVTSQGLYYVPPHSAFINLDIGAAHATLPRIDQVVLRVYDDTHDSSGANKAQVYVVAGTATVGATLDNRTGATALPTSAIRLADILVPAASSTVSNSSIRDRRPWARGASYRTAYNTGNLSTTSASFVAVESTYLNPRIECSGVPVQVILQANRFTHSVAAARGQTAVAVDGSVNVDGGAAMYHIGSATAGGGTGPLLFSYVFVPSAGSHRIAPYFAVADAGTFTIAGGASNPILWSVRELVTQNAANNATTSG